MPKELGLFYVAFLTVRLYIQLDQFIIFQVTLSTLYPQVTSSFIMVFKMLHMNFFVHCDFVDPQHCSWRSPYHTHNNHYLQLEIFNINPQRDNNIVVPTINILTKHTLYQLINQRFGHVYITHTKLNGKERTHGRSPRKFP